jgi:carboxyl-terminal processing protease
MRKIFKNKVLVIALVVIVLAGLFAAIQAGKTADKGKILSQIIVQTLTEYHYSPQKLNDAFSRRAFDLFLKSLDYNKRFLLKSDIEDLKRYQLSIDDLLQDNSSVFLDTATELLNKRVATIENMARDILKKPFDYSAEESFETDPLKRDYPANENELRELWRLLLKYQTEMRYVELIQKNKDASIKEAGLKKDQAIRTEIEAEARESVAKSTVHILERILQQTDDDHYTEYINAITAAFDPHTNYFAPMEKENFDISMTGTLEGIGALLREDNEYTKVQDIIPGSPAWRQKELKPEDIILKVGQGDAEPVDVIGMPLNDVVRLIRGKRGTEVRLTVKKPDGRIMVISIIRDIVVVEETYAKSAVIESQKTRKKVGYVSLPSFYHDFKARGARNSANDVKKELEKLKAENVDGIILDLRNNGGGALDDAIQTAGLFIKSGPVVQVKDNTGEEQVFRDPDPGIVYKGPVVVLVNSFSASASEIVAAALQDYGRAVIIGSTSTFGKGTVQAMLDLDSRLNNVEASLKPLGSLKITIQKFYRINGGSTQSKGVSSDIVLPDVYSTTVIGEKSLEYSLPWDTMDPAQYKKWDGQRYNLGSLKQKSAKRLATNKFFKRLNDKIAQWKEKQGNTQESLKITKLLDKQADLKAETAELEKLQPEQSDIKVYSPKADLKTVKSNADSEKKAAEWYKQLNRDAYINEAMNVLKDIMNP